MAVACLHETDGCVCGSLGLVACVDPRVAWQGSCGLPGALQPWLGSSLPELCRNLVLPLTTQLDLDIQVLPGLQELGVLVITAGWEEWPPVPRGSGHSGRCSQHRFPGAVVTDLVSRGPGLPP